MYHMLFYMYRLFWINQHWFYNNLIHQILCDFSEVMNQPLTCFKAKEKVGVLISVLKEETFCGFPVIADDPLVSI